ncbi:hypothetical protein GCM10009830_28760 [Glycomyces endophyticus]|uniref:Ribokinase n=1 Tax=Glycomyces endophyticus TaxID=480996 RepID=A0ABN2H1E7_9ACTN
MSAVNGPAHLPGRGAGNRSTGTATEIDCAAIEPDCASTEPIGTDRSRRSPATGPGHGSEAAGTDALHDRAVRKPAQPDPADRHPASAAAGPSSGADARVLVVGSVNIDTAVRVSRLPGPGETVSARGSDTALGGKGANQAVAAARAGAAVCMVGAVGAGDGDAALRALDAGGVDTGGIARLDGTPSGRAYVFIDDAAENSIVVVPGANHAIPEAAVREACRALRPGDVVLLQNEIPAETSRLAARLAREAGATVVWNAAPAPESVEELVDRHDLLMVNEHELARIATLLGAADSPSGSASNTGPAAAVNRGLERPAGSGGAGPSADPGTDTDTDTDTEHSARTREIPTGTEGLDPGRAPVERLLAAVAAATGADVICTLGSEGAVYITGGETGRAEARRVEAVDTTAAGDTFAGYFAALAGLPPRERLRFALDAASLAVTRPGASPSIPMRGEVEALAPHPAIADAAPPGAVPADPAAALAGPHAEPLATDPVAADSAAAHRTERNTAR